MMDSRNTVKSKDLCDQCKYTYEEGCRAQRDGTCAGCDHTEGDKCLCDTIRRNTPCPYFDEYGG